MVKNKVAAAASAAVLLIALPAALFVCVIFIHGFSSYGIAEYKLPQQRKYQSWKEVFEESKQIPLSAVKTGDAVAAPYARPYLDVRSLPAGYRTDIEEISPIVSFILRHPLRGEVLIDAGLNGSFSEKPPYGDLPLMLTMYQKATKVSYAQNTGGGIGNSLQKRGITPSFVLLTHVHPDHIAGLSEIGKCVPLVFGKKESAFYYRAMGGKYFRDRSSIFTLDFDRAVSIPPFGKVIDVFGDASLWAISSAGHTVDHISYLVNDSAAPYLIIGDLSVSEEFFEKGILSGSDYDGGGQDLARSLAELNEFRKIYPGVRVLYSHGAIDPESR